MTDLGYNRYPVKFISPYYRGRDKVIDDEGEKKFSFTAIFLRFMVQICLFIAC